MISNPEVLRPPSRRIVLLTKLKNTTMRLGSRTQAFFRRGDELEAAGYENLPHDDPTLVPPKLGFHSFDRVPRNRAPMLIAFLVAFGGSFADHTYQSLYFDLGSLHAARNHGCSFEV